MKTLNELAVEYKKTNKKEILDEIFNLLYKTLKEKAQYIFYQQEFIARKKKFRLCNTKQIQLEDVEQELYLQVLKLLQNYDETKPFDTYLYSTLFSWNPDFINKDFLDSLKNCSSTKIVNGQEIDIFNETPTMPEEIIEESIPIEQKFEQLTNQEKKVINLLKKNPDLTQSQLAEILKVSQPRVNNILSNIRKKYIGDVIK